MAETDAAVAGVKPNALVTSVLVNVTEPVLVLKLVTAPDTLNAAASHAEPVQT
jgi:hypothetical protein